MRLIVPVLCVLVTACTTDGNLRPMPEIASPTGAVEVLVKSNHPALIAEIGAGGGPLLTRVFDAAGVPVQDRPARTLQLRGNLGLYDANPGALVTALSVYGR
jgi:hypothetical protein